MIHIVNKGYKYIQTTGKKCEEFNEELDIKLSGVFCYDEDVLRKTVKNAYKMTILDAVTGYAFEEKVKENKHFDPKYSPIIKPNFPDALHQLCVCHFNNIIDGDLRMADGLKYGKKKELPDEFELSDCFQEFPYN